MFRPRFCRTFIYIVLSACAILAIAQSRLFAAEQSPYEARVVATGAAVHSGPGEKFYPTDTLAQGEIVEVYREKSGGWLAIRPPANSFSWVSAADLDIQDGGMAEVNKDDVASRIGSRLNNKHNAAQVRLKRGEVVEIIDDEMVGNEKWYKIAPPAGEFRWIQASLVERLGGVQTASAEAPIANDATAPPLIDATAQAATPAAAPIPVQPAAVPAAAAQPATTTAVVATTPVAAPAKPQTVSNASVGDDLSHELATIELRLSRMVAAPVNLWNTERLERDTAQLLSRAQSAADRDAVQVTLTKIKQFAVIAQRSAQMPANGVAQNASAPTTPVPATVANGTTPTTAPLASVAPNAPGGPYDAMGILRPVVSKRPGAPQFALVDDAGQVLSFVTPTPDVNLQPYLGRRVGVVGNRGFIAEFNRSHVTAARITPLAAPLVR